MREVPLYSKGPRGSGGFLCARYTCIMRGPKGVPEVGGQRGFMVSSHDRLRVGGVPREQEMLKGHLPRVVYHQVY